VADPFNVGGSSGGSSDPFGRGGGDGAAKPAAKGGGGLLGFFSHGASDLEHTLTAIPGGVVQAVEHPIGTAQAIGHSYAQAYAPLLHGHLSEFLHQVYDHPLGYALDLATLATLGAGGVARAGELAGKAGLISDASRFAHLRDAVPITVPDYAKSAGQSGEDLVVKRSSRNPLIRARQVAVNDALNQLHATTPYVGSIARATRLIKAESSKAAIQLAPKLVPFQNVYARLGTDEQAAFHLVARATDPAAYHSFLQTEKIANPNVSDGLAATLTHPHVQALFHDIKSQPGNPDAFVSASGRNGDLAEALTKGREVSNLMGRAKVARGLIDEKTAAVQPYLGARLLSGAQYLKPTPGKLGNSPALDAVTAERDRLASFHERALNAEAKWTSGGGAQKTPGGITVEGALPASNPYRNRIVQIGQALEAANAKVDRLTVAAGHRVADVGFVGGKPVEQIKADLDAAGRPQPFYLPMRAVASKPSMRSLRVTAKATNVPANFVKHNQGILFKQGMLALGNDVLSPEFLKTVRYARRADLHNALLSHAVALHDGETLPHDWEFVKTKPGEHIPYTEQVRGLFEHGMAPGGRPSFRGVFTTKNAAESGVARDATTGGRMMVPSHAARALEEEVHQSSQLGRVLYDKPTNVWKHLILGGRPAFFANITVGNHVLGALQMAGLHGVAGYLNQLPGHAVEKLLGAKVSRQTMETVFPEQAYGSFGHQMGFHPVKASIIPRDLGRSAKGVGQRLAQGVMPATIRVENFLRRAMLEGWARATPEVVAEMNFRGADINTAIQHVAATHPEIVREISRRVDDALGNYRDYTPAEQRIKQLIPFYGWDRHIVRSTARILSERPGVANALVNVGRQGQALAAQQGVANVPSYMLGDIRIGKPGPDGRTPLLSTHSLNPFATAPELVNLAGALVHGKPGAGGDVLSGALNPIVQGLIEQMTGRSLLSGAPVKGRNAGMLGNLAASIAENTPQASLLEALLGGKAGKTKPGALYSRDARTKLENLLGYPIKRTNLATAAKYARSG
jgi:hypothetical protein